MKNIMFAALLCSLVSLPSTLKADEDLGDHAIGALPSFASNHDLYAMQVSKQTGEVSRLCPAAKEEYATNLDSFQAKIDEAIANPQGCFVWGFRRISGFSMRMPYCRTNGEQLASKLETQKYPVELCYKLHTLKEAYEAALAGALIKSEEQRKLVMDTLGTLETCLKDSKRRSEIESCYAVFKMSIAQILDL